jgi:hypothetical protein
MNIMDIQLHHGDEVLHHAGYRREEGEHCTVEFMGVVFRNKAVHPHTTIYVWVT